jgi:hypothetical protein
MEGADIFDPQERGRRQPMATARRQHESERLALLAQLVDTQRHADESRNWINAYTLSSNDHSYPELRRIAGWVAAQLDDVERNLSPERIFETLQERDLFPEVDSLNDPPGEPTGHRIWGHFAARRHINAV